MNETDTYIKLYRKIVDWRWYKDSITKDVFLHLLIKANIKDCGFQRITVHRGELVTSYANIAFELGLSTQNVRTAIEHLKSTSEITNKAYPKFQVIKILCYEQYQCNQQASQQSSNIQVTGNQQATNNNQRNKEHKNIRNTLKEIIKEKKNYGEFQNVLLSDDELTKLKEEFPQDWQLRIEQLSCSMESTGRTYKNHLATIKNWSKYNNNVSKSTGKHSLDDYVAQAKELDEKRNQRKNALKKMAEEYS